MADVNVRLFGGFEVHRRAGSTVAFPTRKARALFALLARRPGQPQPREKLAAMLWPRSPEPQARGNLRSALKLLRSSLAAKGQGVIGGDGAALFLEPKAVDVDTARFEDLHEAGTPDALEHAAALYRGDFLQGTNLADGPFEDWALVERQRLRERALDIFSTLLDRRVKAGATDPAIEAALRLLELDPLQEHVHRDLMRLYLKEGRRGSALEQYRLCRDTLERELGVQPEAETERLYQDMRRRPVRAEAAQDDAGAGTDAAGSAAVDPVLTRPAVAVLPFANLGGDPEQNYLSDGLSEDLITDLAGWRFFPLIASSSAFLYRDRESDPRHVAAELGARYVVDGSVRREGKTLRINAQLIDGETAHCLWSGRFDLDLQDVLAAQSEAAQKIASVIEPELERAELSRIVAQRTEDMGAWDHFLKGWSLVNRFNAEDNARARAEFEQALGLDPSYSDALMGLANGYLRDLLGEQVSGKAREDKCAQAMAAAREAVRLDPNSSAAHLVLGQAHIWAEELEEAIVESELAVELNPSNAHARMALGNRLDLIGRTEDGIAQMENSLQLNRRDPRRFNYMGFLSRAHVSLGKFETALAWAREAVQVRPDHPDMHYRLAICLAHLDRVDEARAALNECERLRRGFLESRKSWKPYSDAARNEAFFAGVQRHRLLE